MARPTRRWRATLLVVGLASGALWYLTMMVAMCAALAAPPPSRKTAKAIGGPDGVWRRTTCWYADIISETPDEVNYPSGVTMTSDFLVDGFVGPPSWTRVARSPRDGCIVLRHVRTG